MDIQSLKLKGMTGIRKGLGLEELELDFSQATGLIALAGPTGAGKTTIMENLQPFPQLVSRPEKALKNHVFLRDSFKDLVFNYNGNQYRTLTKIDSESGRAEGFIWQNGQPQVNGKITEYTKYITKLFGSPNLFFNSVFCAQNSVKMSGLRPAELKALFAEFLGPRLQKLTDYEAVAKECLLSLSVRISSMDTEIQRLNSIIEKEAELMDELEKTNNAKDAVADSLEQTKDLLSKRRVNLAEDRRQKIIEEQIRQQIVNRQESLVNERSRKTYAELQADDIAMKLKKRKTNIYDELSEVEELLAEKDKILTAKTEADRLFTAVADADKNIADTKELVQHGERGVYELKIKHTNKTASAKDEILKIEENISEEKNRIETEKELSARALERLDALLSDPDFLKINFEIENLKSKITDLEKRDKACTSTTCSFITGALGAQARLPIMIRKKNEIQVILDQTKKQIQSELALRKKNIEVINGSLKITEQDKNSLTSRYRKEYRNRETVITETENKQTRNKTKVNRLMDEKEILAAKHERVKKLAEKTQDIFIAEEKKAALLLRVKELSLIIVEKDAAHTADIKQRLERINKIVTEIDSLRQQIDCDLANKIKQSIDRIEQLEQAVEEAKETLNRTETAAAFIEKDLLEIKKAVTAKKEIEIKKQHILKELSDWSYLKDACGANGLRALEIDSVAPSITHDANLLLEQAFGAWAMVDFRTQNDDGKEVLEPRVIDQDGDSVLIGNRSGGQQVWALKALRLAMTMISKKRSGKDFQTIFADEDDAGLDIETAQSFTKLYRALMDMGGFKKCFFISHKPQCVAMADSVIDLSEYK